MLGVFNDDLDDELDDIDNAAADDYDRRPHDDDGGADHYFDDFLHLILDNRTVDYFDQLAVRMFGRAWSAWFG